MYAIARHLDERGYSYDEGPFHSFHASYERNIRFPTLKEAKEFCFDNCSPDESWVAVWLGGILGYAGGGFWDDGSPDDDWIRCWDGDHAWDCECSRTGRVLSNGDGYCHFIPELAGTDRAPEIIQEHPDWNLHQAFEAIAYATPEHAQWGRSQCKCGFFKTDPSVGDDLNAPHMYQAWAAHVADVAIEVLDFGPLAGPVFRVLADSADRKKPPLFADIVAAALATALPVANSRISF